MALGRNDSLFCEKCKKIKKVRDFYHSNNTEKFEDGVIPICRECYTMHIDNWDSSTYLPLLEEVDVPYVPHLWNKLMSDYAKDPRTVTGATIFGRYLSMMKLGQWRKYRWADTDFIQKLQDKKIEDAMTLRNATSSEIAQAIEENHIAMREIPRPEIPEEKPEEVEEASEEIDDYFARQSGAADDPDLDLTDEDKTYLRLKWGKTYKPEEWVWLE